MYIYGSNPWIEPWSFRKLLAFWSCLKTGSRSSMLDVFLLQIISISKHAISPVEKPPQRTNPMSVEKVYLNLSIQCLLFESIVLRVSWLHIWIMGLGDGELLWWILNPNLGSNPTQSLFYLCRVNEGGLGLFFLWSNRYAVYAFQSSCYLYLIVRTILNSFSRLPIENDWNFMCSKWDHFICIHLFYVKSIKHLLFV
jgi:hypothetical protein